MKKRLVSTMLAVMISASMLSGCGSEAKQSSSKTVTGAKAEHVNITFWHGMGGNLGVSLNKLVKDFNDSQKTITVTAQFQGDYDSALNKLKSSQLSNSGPDVMQSYDIGTRYMIDSKAIVPVQNFIDKEKYDTSTLEPNLLAYYTVDKKLNSMPFNSSTPILYYNKTAFKAAGLDPNTPPKTLTEVETMAKKLLKKDASGKVTQYGYAMPIYAWFFEQFMIKQGKNYANNGNGRTVAATTVEYNKNGGGLTVLNEWKKLVDSGDVGNFGRKTQDTQNAFMAGNTAMYLDSTASLSSVLNGVNKKFEVGTGFLPKVNSTDKGGVSIGGASLWIMDKKDEAKQQASWEFLKFMVSAKEQAYWNANTGYFPVNKQAYNLKEVKDNLVKYPQFQTAINQLHASTPDSKGALLGVFPEARAATEINIESMLGGKQTPQEALDNAAKTANSAIEKYNKTNK
ncbi:ABC transporter substrate-binding protein [Clostridium estertheticum]|uniref:ABC transporter substrate-binding protein n=1 Tax=Clostridium estertheticum subsp. estertheticum TaxID=1552 RepID=A0A1J0GK22_9CLOT|nr:ABC transporter substrate-binding protein [Clostridium estertheticum]APC41675.1 ABC transporter substrate-binding protein [Clostridium estertheticum subsp. estertheticum]MBZ9616446.1 ABC transporter substrate-binding protein [Clostridium estertheticum subsp. laramiense]WAG72177.1 ABC transporter substrate-binding protein [Clostridium estertheticum]